jgi:hypothetical protein
MSRTILIIGMLAMAYASFIYYPKWKYTRTEATISWDVSGYYLYLPAVFIYHDVKELQFKARLDSLYYPSSSPYQAYTHRSGKQVMKYTCGLAILYAPFFLLAHGIALVSGQVADGYAPIYQFFISFGSLIYAFIGLIFLRKLLLRYFSDELTAVALAILIFATNYFDYASITGAMSHNYLFTLYAVLLICIDNFYKEGKRKWFYYICFIIGLMALIRPTEIISKILLVGWNVDSLEGLKNRFLYFFKQIPMLFKGAIFFVICPFLQIMYWKYVTGEWLVYSYQDQGFSWFEGHHILQGLYSYRAGWLVYTPVMILSLIGLLYLWISKYALRWPLTIFILASLYFTFAWDEWTYGGSLGQRALIQHYPVMIFSMMPFLQKFYPNMIFKNILFLFVGGCIYYNLWLTHQAHKGGIFEAGMMNKAYFWHTLFKSENDLESKKLLDTNEPMLDFEQATATLKIDTTYTSDSLRCVQNDRALTMYQGLMPKGKIKIKTLIQSGDKEWDVWRMAQLIVQYRAGNKDVKTVFIRVHRFLNSKEEKWIDLVTQSPTASYDDIKISLWNPSPQSLCVQSLKVYAE